ncbi:hypothetical protein AJ87_21775 [Rhizobium yanglingense]|nr:hypothetical protein AJ87_21775 [Rhizobium yanglingense]
MVPTYWVTVSELPQTGNGKLDRKTLQQRGIPAHSTEAKKTKPRTPMEEQLAAIWQDILGSQDIGVDDNLYALGADSLTIFRMAARMLTPISRWKPSTSCATRLSRNWPGLPNSRSGGERSCPNACPQCGAAS